MKINAIKEFHDILTGNTREYPESLSFGHIDVYQLSEKDIANSDVTTMEALLLKIPDGKVCIQGFSYDTEVQDINIAGILFNPESENFIRCFVLYQRNEDIFIMDYNLYCNRLYSVEGLTNYIIAPENREKLQAETEKAILNIVRTLNMQKFSITLHKSSFE